MSDLISPRVLLRSEGLATLIAFTVLYYFQHQSWWLYGGLFFAPDLLMLGYLVNKAFGALVYNLGHTYAMPLLLIAAGFCLPSGLTCALGMIWCSHIGFDRLLGFGLKYPTDFKDTHLRGFDGSSGPTAKFRRKKRLLIPVSTPRRSTANQIVHVIHGRISFPRFSRLVCPERH